MIHANGPTCDKCNEKLLQCHDGIKAFFNWLKPQFPDAHIAWGFRDYNNQRIAFLTGKSQLDWPDSLHNFMQNNVPCSKAIDLFRLDENGKAQFETQYYKIIWDITAKNNFGITWGGNFPHFKDNDHFQLN